MYWSAGEVITLLEGASFVLFVKLVVLVYVAMLKAYPFRWSAERGAKEVDKALRLKTKL